MTKSKPIEFKTKIIHENKIYLKISDVAKALLTTTVAFKEQYSDMIVKIPTCGECILEMDFNRLLSENLPALQKQSFLEVTRLETLRNKIDSVIGFQPLKLLLARDYLKMMADRTGCKSEQEYILLHELPEEKRKALKELLQTNTSKSSYEEMIGYLNDKERFDLDKVRGFGLDIQYLIAIENDGRMRLDVYVVGEGVFYEVTNFGNYEDWNGLYRDGNGDLILPYCNYDSNNPEEVLINLSQTGINRDFSKYNAVKNMFWCIENLEVGALEDYEYEVFGCHKDSIDFSMSIELLAKIIKPSTVDTIYTDRLIDIETGMYLTDVKDMKVFVEDI